MADDPKPDDKPDDDKPDDKPDPDAGAKRALEEERKARRDAERQAKDLEARLKAIEDKDKSEVERLTEQVAALTKERDDAVTKADRLEVAVTKALDETTAKRLTTAAKRLVGTTREELEADADDLLESFAVTTTADDEKKPPPGGKPREDLKPGSGDPDVPPEETDVSKLGERMFRR